MLYFRFQNRKDFYKIIFKIFIESSHKIFKDKFLPLKTFNLMYHQTGNKYYTIPAVLKEEENSIFVYALIDKNEVLIGSIDSKTPKKTKNGIEALELEEILSIIKNNDYKSYLSFIPGKSTTFLNFEII